MIREQTHDYRSACFDRYAASSQGGHIVLFGDAARGGCAIFPPTPAARAKCS